MLRTALAAAALLAVALTSGGAAQPRAAVGGKRSPLLGLELLAPDRATLVRMNPRTLRPRPGAKLRLGSAGGWAFSPDASLLAIGHSVGQVEDSADLGKLRTYLRLVDPARLRITGELSVGRGSMTSAAWLGRDRIATVLQSCCALSETLVLVDPSQRRVVARRAVDPIGAQQGGSRLVVLEPTRDAISPVRLVVVDRTGPIRSVVLERIEGGGNVTGEGAEVSVDRIEPALTVSPDGSRALVISPGSLVADVDLSTLTVAYHAVASRLHRPATANKRFEGAVRFADLLPNGLVAVTGYDVRPDDTYLPAGVRLLDPSSWTVRGIDAHADRVTVAGSALLATRWARTGMGVTGYSFTGTRRFHLLGHRPAIVEQSFGTRAFVSIGDHPLRVLDVRKGRVVGRRNGNTFPWLLFPGAHTAF